MKRTFLAAALAAAAVLAPAPAFANHICVTSGGEPVACAPDPEDLVTIEQPKQICVKYGSTSIVCVF